MAVIEIAKIQIRRGRANVEGIPQFDSAEMGWALDTQQLYIGNGSLSEGAPIEGNTRVLTERDLPNIFALTSSTYIYSEGSSPTRYTDPSGSTSTVRTIQDKLDDFVTVRDFGVNSGVPVYSNQGIQNAIDQLFLNSDKSLSSSRVTLKIPAGIYNLTATIYVPPYVTIVGDGKRKTVLNVLTTATSAFQLCDFTSTPGSYVVFVPGSTNITSGGRPYNVHISNLSLRYSSTLTDYTNAQPLLLLDCAINSTIEDVSFYGTTVTNQTNYSAIEIRGQDALTTENVTLSRVDFDNLCNAIISNYDVENISVNNAVFSNLDRGIKFTESLVSGNEVGPKNFTVSDSVFTDIRNQAWFVGTNTNNTYTGNVSKNNKFYNVGNDLLGEFSATTAVLTFHTPGNRSENDYFNRLESINSTATDYKLGPLVEGAVFINEEKTNTFSIASGGPTIFSKLPWSQSDQKLQMQYIIKKPSAAITRSGTVSIFLRDTLANLTDTFSYSGSSDGSLSFSAQINTVTNIVSLAYTSADSDGTVDYTLSYLQ